MRGRIDAYLAGGQAGGDNGGLGHGDMGGGHRGGGRSFEHILAVCGHRSSCTCTSQCVKSTCRVAFPHPTTHFLTLCTPTPIQTHVYACCIHPGATLSCCCGLCSSPNAEENSWRQLASCSASKPACCTTILLLMPLLPTMKTTVLVMLVRRPTGLQKAQSRDSRPLSEAARRGRRRMAAAATTVLYFKVF